MVTSTLAAVIWPANFVSASRPHLSSIKPIPLITPPPTTPPPRHRPPGHTRRVDEPAREGRQLGGQQYRSQHADIHREATHSRRGRSMDIAFAVVRDRAQSAS